MKFTVTHPVSEPEYRMLARLENKGGIRLSFLARRTPSCRPLSFLISHDPEKRRQLIQYFLENRTALRQLDADFPKHVEAKIHLTNAILTVETDSGSVRLHCLDRKPAENKTAHFNASEMTLYE